MRKTRKRLLRLFAGILLVAHIGSYLVLSRLGYAEADRWNMKGFYYFTPEDSKNWEYRNYGCMYLYYPLNIVDRNIGLGRHPGSAPLWGLSAGAKETDEPHD